MAQSAIKRVVSTGDSYLEQVPKQVSQPDPKKERLIQDRKTNKREKGVRVSWRYVRSRCAMISCMSAKLAMTNEV